MHPWLMVSDWMLSSAHKSDEALLVFRIFSVLEPTCRIRDDTSAVRVGGEFRARVMGRGRGRVGARVEIRARVGDSAGIRVGVEVTVGAGARVTVGAEAEDSQCRTEGTRKTQQTAAGQVAGWWLKGPVSGAVAHHCHDLFRLGRSKCDSEGNLYRHLGHGNACPEHVVRPEHLPY